MKAESISEDLPADPSDIETKWASVRKSQDPYAYYAVFGDQEDAEPPALNISAPTALPSHQVVGLSKKDFHSACRRIFLQYTPQAEGQVLRPQYRDFIVRNEQRSPVERAGLVAELSRYDFHSSGNFKPHFNREQELLTQAKLREIEKTVLKSGGSK